MKFSKKVYYGFKFLLALTAGNKDDYYGIMQVSIGEDIPLKFLEAIAVSLKKADIVDVKRGAGGGYRLKRDAHAINALEVVQVLEDSYGKTYGSKAVSNNEKAVSGLLDDISTDFSQRLKTYSIADLKKRFDEMNENEMYYI